MRVATDSGSRRRSGGFTLMEVLVAVLLLSVGILGLVALETIALQSNQNALLRSQASVLAYDLVDKMRANKQGAWAGDYDFALGGSLGTAPASCLDYSGGSSLNCTPSSIAADELHAWVSRIQDLFPAGQASVARTPADINSGAAWAYQIQIRWDEDRDGTVEVNPSDDHPDELFSLTFTL